MTIAVFNTKSRGMVYGQSKRIGEGMIIKPTCHRCGLSRNNAAHKRTCRTNPNPLWS